MGLDDITYTTEYRAKTFVSLPLSNCKFEGVVAYANNVLDVKNLISIYIVNHYEDFIVGDTLVIINKNAFISIIQYFSMKLYSNRRKQLKQLKNELEQE